MFTGDIPCGHGDCVLFLVSECGLRAVSHDGHHMLPLASGFCR